MTPRGPYEIGCPAKDDRCAVTNAATSPLDDALKALAWMCEQYIGDHAGELDHQFMAAGEHAVKILVQHGLVEPRRRGGVWTEKGRALLEAP